MALGTSFLAMVGFAPSASAHHANIKGSTDCGGLVSWTASSWSNADGAGDNADVRVDYQLRSEEHTSELQSLMRISYAVFCWKKKNRQITQHLLTNNISMIQ